MLVSNVVLVNLLVAMFSDTYSRVKGKADVEWYYQAYNRLFMHQKVLHVVPPPLNLPLVIYNGVGWLLHSARQQLSCASCCAEPDAAATPKSEHEWSDPTSMVFREHYLTKRKAEESATLDAISRGTSSKVSELLEEKEANASRLRSLGHKVGG